MRRADDAAFRVLRAAALTLRLPRVAFFFDTFGSIRRAPRTARRAAPVAVRATPAATSVANDAAPPAAPLIASPAFVMILFFAMRVSLCPCLPEPVCRQVGRFCLVPDHACLPCK